MFLATGEARYVDVLELALYNAVLSGVSLDGTNYFYVNPLRQVEPLPTKLRWSRTRVPFVTSYCCPPNVLRTIAEVNGYAYSKTDDAIWVNLYGGNTLSTKLDGKPLKLTQTTNYPWDGRVRITIDECPTDEFALKLRIPGWAESADDSREWHAGRREGDARHLRRDPPPLETGRRRRAATADAGPADRSQSAGGGDSQSGGDPARADRVLPRIARLARRASACRTSSIPADAKLTPASIANLLGGVDGDRNRPHCASRPATGRTRSIGRSAASRSRESACGSSRTTPGRIAAQSEMSVWLPVK